MNTKNIHRIKFLFYKEVTHFLLDNKINISVSIKFSFFNSKNLPLSFFILFLGIHFNLFRAMDLITSKSNLKSPNGKRNIS